MRLRDRISLAWRALSGRVRTRMYAGARLSRLTADWYALQTSSDAELASSLATLRARSRALCRDVAYARRAKMLAINNIVGCGIQMQPQVYTTRGELSDRINADISSLWEEWSAADSCHTGGRFSFAMLERAIVGQLFEAGEVFVRLHFSAFGRSRVPLALEIIEAERIADDFADVRDGREIRMGVEIDEYQRPVAYYVRGRHPSELRFIAAPVPESVERVPADRMIHIALGDRWPQTRGEPWMVAVIRTIRDIAGYTEAEITRARIQAATPWTIETPDAAWTFGETTDGGVEMRLEPGTVKRLNPGEKLNVPNTTAPNPAAEDFVRTLLREFAVGAQINYASVSGDYSQSNYSSSRIALPDDRDVWRAMQDMLIDTFRMPVHRAWIQQAVIGNALPSIPPEAWALDRRRYEAVRFRPRGWGWIDPESEIASYIEAVRAGFMSLHDVAAQTGADFAEILEERARELAMAESMGVPLSTTPQEDAVQANQSDDGEDSADESRFRVVGA